MSIYGYVCVSSYDRYWHYYTNESSKIFYKQALVDTIKRNYFMFHTMAPEVAIDNLKEIYKQ